MTPTLTPTNLKEYIGKEAKRHVEQMQYYNTLLRDIRFYNSHLDRHTVISYQSVRICSFENGQAY